MGKLCQPVFLLFPCCSFFFCLQSFHRGFASSRHDPACLHFLLCVLKWKYWEANLYGFASLIFLFTTVDNLLPRWCTNQNGIKLQNFDNSIICTCRWRYSNIPVFHPFLGALLGLIGKAEILLGFVEPFQLLSKLLAFYKISVNFMALDWPNLFIGELDSLFEFTYLPTYLPTVVSK